MYAIGDRVRVKLFRFSFNATVIDEQFVGDQRWITVSNGSRYHESYIEAIPAEEPVEQAE